MKRRILSVLVAILFAMSAFAVPAAVAAKGDSRQTLTQKQPGEKHKTKKSTKKAKKKNKSTKLSSKKKAKSKKHQSRPV